MKLAAGYIVFDGLETLEASIRSVRNNVDFIIVAWQDVSWGGTSASPELIPTLQRLKEDGLIDRLIHFRNFTPSILRTPADVLRSKQYELTKRQACLDMAKDLKQFSHYLSMDADEFYREPEFKMAKEIIERDSLDATAVNYVNYVTPILHRGYSRWKVPFIYRITPKTRHHVMQTTFSGIDPTRGLVDDSYAKSLVFDRDIISMHHMEMIRDDLTAKYLASSRYFPNRALLPGMADDIIKAKKTKVLTFTRAHLGDTDTPHANQQLIECKNEFGL
jgi:hypothetical protein